MLMRILIAPGTERGASIARVLRDFPRRWRLVLADEPSLITSRHVLGDTFVAYVDKRGIARRPLLHVFTALARDTEGDQLLWDRAGFLGEMLENMVTRALGGGQPPAAIVASLFYGSPSLPRIKRVEREPITDATDVRFIVYPDQLAEAELALQREYTTNAWATVIQDLMRARRATRSLDVVAALREAYRHADSALVSTYVLFAAHDRALGPFVATSAEVMMDELSHMAVSPAALDRNVYWDGLVGRLQRELGAALSVGLRPLRRYEAIGPARQLLRNAENELYMVLSQRRREAVRTNRLDPLLALRPTIPDDRPLLARGSTFFQRWLHEGDTEIGRCEVATVPWNPAPGQSGVFEILETRDLRHHVRAFVRWQAPANPFTYDVIRHVRPEDFATVDGGQTLVAGYRNRAGESALTGILHPTHPRAARPSASTLISAVAFLMARGIYYRRWSPVFALLPPGNRSAFVAGFAAWTRTRPVDYIVQMATAIDPEHVTEVGRRISEEYAERSAGRALPPLVPVVAPPVLPVPVAPAPPAPLPTAPSILPPHPVAPAPVTRAPWEGLDLTADLTRSSAFDALQGPMQMHIAARGTLNERRVYVELVDARIYEKVQAPMGAAAGAFVRVPQSAWKIARGDVAARWPTIWSDALAKMELDVKERRAEAEKLKRLLVPQTESVLIKDFQFHTRTIEPIDYVPMEGELMLLVYADDGWEEVTGAGLLPASSDERDASPVAALLKMIGEAQGATMAYAQWAVLDYFAFVRRGDEFRIRGLDCFLAWPLYASYIKRPLHGFYELQDEEAAGEAEEPDTAYQERPEAVSDAIGEEAWRTAAAEYSASPTALTERVIALTGLPWPDAAADGPSLVFCAAYCLAQGLTTRDAFATHVRERADVFYQGLRDVVRLDESLLARLRLVAETGAAPSGAAETLFSVSGAVQREGGDRYAFDIAYQGEARTFVDNYDQHDALLQQVRAEIVTARVYAKACASLPGREKLEEARRTVDELQPAYAEAKKVDEATRTAAQNDIVQRVAAAKRVISSYAGAGAKVAALAGTPSLAGFEEQQKALRSYVNDDARFFAYEKATIALDETREHNETVIPPGIRVAEQLAFNARAHGALHEGASAAFFLMTMSTIERLRTLTNWPLAYWVGLLIDADEISAFAQAMNGKAAALQAYCSDDALFGANIIRFLISNVATDALEEERANHPRKLIARLLTTGGLDNAQERKITAADIASDALISRSFLSRDISSALAELNSKFPTAVGANNAKLTAPAVTAVLSAIARRFREMGDPAQSERLTQLLASDVRFLDLPAMRAQRLSDLLAFRITDVPLSALVTAAGTETTMARGTTDGEFDIACSAVCDLLLAGNDRETVQRDLLGDLMATSLGAASAFATTVAEKVARKRQTAPAAGEEAGFRVALRWDTALAEWGRSLFVAPAVILNGSKEKGKKKKSREEELVEEERDDAYRILSTTKSVHDVVVAAALRPDGALRPTTVVPSPPPLAKKDRFLGIALPQQGDELPLPLECQPLPAEEEAVLLGEYTVVEVAIPERFRPVAGEKRERVENEESEEAGEEEEEGEEREEPNEGVQEEEQPAEDVMEIVEEAPVAPPLRRLKKKQAPPAAPLPVPPPAPSQPTARRVQPRPLAPGDPGF
jgi:hypothetical protein